MMQKADKVKLVIDTLEHHFPETPIPLDHKDPYTLLIAVLLSAQSTDAGVNKVTPILFERADNPYDMVKLTVEEIRSIIRPVGLSPAKSKNIHALSQILIDQYQGIVPESLDDLESLPGVGHKTASVVVSQAFGVPAFPVDTHIQRLMYRWTLHPALLERMSCKRNAMLNGFFQENFGTNFTCKSSSLAAPFALPEGTIPTHAPCVQKLGVKAYSSRVKSAFLCLMSNSSQRYAGRGVSSDKAEVHAAIKHLDKGLFPNAFCKIMPDVVGGDDAFVNIMHADTAGTKPSLAYLYWKATGDHSVWKDIVQDALIMNIDDMIVWEQPIIFLSPLRLVAISILYQVKW